MGKKSKSKVGSRERPLIPLYPDVDGVPILTNSMMSTYRRCPRQAMYKYVDRLKPIHPGKPLKRGKWVHRLLEIDALGGDWREEHLKLSRKFDQLFDEEKDHYGDLPQEIKRIMTSYFWHYKDDPWTWHEVELELTADLPNGVRLRIKFDGLIENQFGLWLVDHKTHRTLPNFDYRLLDTQSPIYMWVAWRNEIPVQGFIWNYIRWKAPTVPQLLKDGSRFSRSAIDTDYPTYYRALKRSGLDPAPYLSYLKTLKSHRYVPGEMQKSEFFRRSVIEKSPEMVDRVLKEAMRTADRMNRYDFDDRDGVERVVGRHCQFMCSYTALCTAELVGGHTRPLIRQNFRVGDPMSYYHDRVGDTGEED